MNRKILYIVGVFAAVALSAATGERYVIANRDGATVEIYKPAYDGELLRGTRVADGLRISLAPSDLDPESWAALNARVTEDMRVGVDVRTIGPARNYRACRVRVSSTSYFAKPCRVSIYYFNGSQVMVGRHDLELSREDPFVWETGSEVDLDGIVLRTPPDRGAADRPETDLVVVAEHADGSIAGIEATSPAAELLVRGEYEL
ncbi:hypothetical protein ACWPKS_15855 [Coraliomargarita sp. W4R72]